MAKTDWSEVIAGAAIIAVTIGDSPLIPDEIIGVPLGISLILDGIGWL